MFPITAVLSRYMSSIMNDVTLVHSPTEQGANANANANANTNSKAEAAGKGASAPVGSPAMHVAQAEVLALVRFIHVVRGLVAGSAQRAFHA
jgi:hypothetical protein